VLVLRPFIELEEGLVWFEASSRNAINEILNRRVFTTRSNHCKCVTIFLSHRDINGFSPLSSVVV
jgi:hypothetical protein